MIVQPRASLTISTALGKPGSHRRLLCALGFILLSQSGCATQQKAASHKEYILAARYDLGATRTVAGGEQATQIQQDLQRIKSFGFNTVLFDYLEDAQRPELLNAATHSGLRAYITDRDLHYYLLTGKLRGTDTVEALIRAKLQPLASHPGFAGVAILSGYPKDRAAAACAAVESAGIDCLVPGQSGYQTNRGSVVAWLNANDSGNPNVSQIERLLLELNGELYAGWNDGLVIDFAPESDSVGSSPSPSRGEGRGEGKDDLSRLPSDGESEPPPEGLLLPAPNPRARMFAVESLLRRANLWGARLRGFERQLIPADGLRRDPAFTAAVYVRGPRRYLFVFNQSSQPVRGPIRFPAMLAGTPVVRAVGIPATADRIAGDVFEAHGGELAVQVNLRPGDAALFELF